MNNSGPGASGFEQDLCDAWDQSWDATSGTMETVIELRHPTGMHLTMDHQQVQKVDDPEMVEFPLPCLFLVGGSGTVAPLPL